MPLARVFTYLVLRSCESALALIDRASGFGTTRLAEP